MANVGVVVDDLAATIDFFREVGLELEGRATIEGEWAGRVTGLGHQRVEIAMMRTPDGHGRLELSRFLTPPAVADHRNAPGERSRLLARHARRGRHRRHAEAFLHLAGLASEQGPMPSATGLAVLQRADLLAQW